MKKIIVAIVIVGCFSGCASISQSATAKKKMKKYNMYMNDHPDRDRYQKY